MKGEDELVKLCKNVEDIILRKANNTLRIVLEEIEKVKIELFEANYVLQRIISKENDKNASELQFVSEIIKTAISKL